MTNHELPVDDGGEGDYFVAIRAAAGTVVTIEQAIRMDENNRLLEMFTFARNVTGSSRIGPFHMVMVHE